LPCRNPAPNWPIATRASAGRWHPPAAATAGCWWPSVSRGEYLEVEPRGSEGLQGLMWVLLVCDLPVLHDLLVLLRGELLQNFWLQWTFA
jgi:hypothetical protein